MNRHSVNLIWIYFIMDIQAHYNVEAKYNVFISPY